MISDHDLPSFVNMCLLEFKLSREFNKFLPGSCFEVKRLEDIGKQNGALESRIQAIESHFMASISSYKHHQNFAHKALLHEIFIMIKEFSFEGMIDFKDNHLDEFISSVVETKCKSFEVFTSKNKLMKMYNNDTKSDDFIYWWNVHCHFSRGTSCPDGEVNKILRNKMQRSKDKVKAQAKTFKSMVIAVLDCKFTPMIISLESIAQRSKVEDQLLFDCYEVILACVEDTVWKLSHPTSGAVVEEEDDDNITKNLSSVDAASLKEADTPVDEELVESQPENPKQDVDEHNNNITAGDTADIPVDEELDESQPENPKQDVDEHNNNNITAGDTASPKEANTPADTPADTPALEAYLFKSPEKQESPQGSQIQFSSVKGSQSAHVSHSDTISAVTLTFEEENGMLEFLSISNYLKLCVCISGRSGPRRPIEDCGGGGSAKTQNSSTS